MLKYIVLVLGLIFSLVIGVWYIYSQQYVQNSSTEATRGILFKKTLHLPAYKRVSSGNAVLGSYDRYSRSDRMGADDAITVYCKDYCSKSPKPIKQH